MPGLSIGDATTSKIPTNKLKTGYQLTEATKNLPVPGSYPRDAALYPDAVLIEPLQHEKRYSHLVLALKEAYQNAADVVKVRYRIQLT